MTRVMQAKMNFSPNLLIIGSLILCFTCEFIKLKTFCSLDIRFPRVYKQETLFRYEEFFKSKNGLGQ